MNFTRRHFISYAALPFVKAAQHTVEFSDYPKDFRVVIQESSPRVKCFDLRNLTEWQTPANSFFSFHQTRTVAGIDLNSWRLEISGSVPRPRSLTYADLAQYAQQEIPATIECAGNNGHSTLMNGLVSNGVWSGPALAPLLRECGVLPEAREVVFFGMDIERERKWPAAEREFDVPHGRSVFIQDALEGNTILALRLNGRPLPDEHGYPLRLIMPGWYGMTQVKWLTRILVLDRRYEGRHMARNYHSIRTAADGLIVETSIGRNKLKSVVARVWLAGSLCGISGAAWGGSNDIERVDVRIDGGTWRQAQILRKSAPQAWSLWTFQCELRPGAHTVVSRAVDSRGQIQPERTGFLSAREDNTQWPRRIVVRDANP